jgi:hypothetical protein
MRGGMALMSSRSTRNIHMPKDKRTNPKPVADILERVYAGNKVALSNDLDISRGYLDKLLDASEGMDGATRLQVLGLCLSKASELRETAAKLDLIAAQILQTK